jgi:hypothetical protein
MNGRMDQYFFCKPRPIFFANRPFSEEKSRKKNFAIFRISQCFGRARHSICTKNGLKNLEEFQLLALFSSEKGLRPENCGRIRQQKPPVLPLKTGDFHRSNPTYYPHFSALDGSNRRERGGNWDAGCPPRCCRRRCASARERFYALSESDSAWTREASGS